MKDKIIDKLVEELYPKINIIILNKQKLIKMRVI